MIDIVGLYLDPLENALVLSVDEKDQIQTLDRTQPELPLRGGNPRRLIKTPTNVMEQPICGGLGRPHRRNNGPVGRSQQLR